MKLKLAIAAIALLCCSVVVHADGGSPDIIIQVNGALTTPQGEAFAVSYEADVSGNNAPYGLVAGTLSYSSSGPMGPLTGGAGPEGGDWTDASGDQILLLLFRQPGCGTTPDNPCQPEISPNEQFAPGTTNAELNAFANGIFEVIPAGQFFSPGIFGDVKVSFVPEPSTYVMLIAGIVALIALRSVRSNCSAAESGRCTRTLVALTRVHLALDEGRRNLLGEQAIAQEALAPSIEVLANKRGRPARRWKLR